MEELLRKLTRANETWYRGSEQEKAFQELNSKLISAVHFNPKEVAQVTVPATVAQKQDDGYFKLGMYSSRSLSQIESRYSQSEKGALVVVGGKWEV